MKKINESLVAVTHTHTRVFYQKKGGSLFITSSFLFGAKEEVDLKL